MSSRIVGVDFEAIEKGVYIISELNNPPHDPHRTKAVLLFQCQPDDVTPEMRRIGKQANYFETYGRPHTLRRKDMVYVK